MSAMAAQGDVQAHSREGLARRVLLFFFSHRTLAVLRWDLHFLGVRLANSLSGMRARAQREVAVRPRPVYVNLGSGFRPAHDPHWINLDAFGGRNVDFCIDFARGLPFADGSLDGVFHQHVFEHFDLETGANLAKEVRRILKPGGVFRVIVPDAEKAMRAYAEGVIRSYRSGISDADAINRLFRQRYEHQYAYDFETLALVLRRAGFTKVERLGLKGGSALAEMDDAIYEVESLYVEATR